MGAKSKLKSGAAGDKKGKPPLWIPGWHGQPATSRASPPQGTAKRRSSQCRVPSSPGDARGGAPCIRKLKISPFPGGEGGGGMGAENQAKGRSGRRQRGHVPPPGTAKRRSSQCRVPSTPGDARGEAPCIRKLKVSPFPGGEGGWGDGAVNQAKGRVGGRQERQAPPVDSGMARSAGDQPGKPPPPGTKYASCSGASK